MARIMPALEFRSFHSHRSCEYVPNTARLATLIVWMEFFWCFFLNISTILYEFTPPPPGRRGEITIAVAVDGIEVRRFGDLWGRTEVGPMRWSPETYGADRGKKAGIGGMRDTPDGLYASPMVLGGPEGGSRGGT